MANDILLYMALSSGSWRKIPCKDPEHAAEILDATEQTLGVTHWATCPIERDDGGSTPPPSARIHEKRKRADWNPIR